MTSLKEVGPPQWDVMKVNFLKYLKDGAVAAVSCSILELQGSVQGTKGILPRKRSKNFERRE